MRRLKPAAVYRRAESNLPSTASVMSRTSAPVLTSLLLLLLLPRNSAAATKKQEEQHLKSCKSLDEVLLEKYVTEQKRSSSDDVSENATATSLPSGSLTDSNWLALYLLLQDRAEQLCDKKLYTLLNERYSDYNHRQDNATTTIAVLTAAVGSKDQQANNVTLSSTAQKESTWINASTARLTYNNDESSGKFFLEKDEEGSTTSYYESSSSSTILPGNFNQTFTIADNEASGNNSNETLTRDNEDESYRNEAIHADSKEKFRRHKKKQPSDQDERIVEKFSESEDEIVDVPKSASIEIDGNSTIDEHDEFVNNFFANENSEASNETVSEHDEIVDDYFANENSEFSNETVSEHDEMVDDFFANENESSISDFVNTYSTEAFNRENDSAGDKFVDDFFANENEYLSENGLIGSRHSKNMFDESQNNNSTSERDQLVDHFFASENENLTINGIGSEESSKDSRGTLDDKANNNKTASSEFNSTKSQDDISSAELTPSMEHFFEEFSNENENSTNWEELTSNIENENSTISQEVSLTKSSFELFDEANITSSEIAEVTDFSNNTSSENSLSKLENSTDSSELISPKEFLEMAISEEEKNAAPHLRTYSNETGTATPANGTEDRSTKYPDTGDRNKAGHTTSSVDDLFKETTTTTAASAATATMTTVSLDDWSSTIASIESHTDEKVSELVAGGAAVQRRRRNILMTFQEEASVDVAASSGKLRAPEATLSSSSRLVNEEDDSGSDAWESSRDDDDDSSLNTRASSRNRPPRIITSEMNKSSSNAELQRQYRTFLLGLQQSRQTQFAEKRGSRRHRCSQASTKVEQ